MDIDPERSQELDWPKRLNIIPGVARGLLCLHQDSQLQIIHRDIKASNILLDEKMHPKISDFCLARLFQLEETHVNTMVAGTLILLKLYSNLLILVNYTVVIWPQSMLGGQLSIKADVYSFGVLILEIMCGRKKSDSRLPLEYQSFLE
ncbi:cold-responsive protein kinase 1-like [Cryptomeria japonica]|uniref:cold-responsive protein kinase 1-like n=1 Tax=Cryptomeria japonica TaxID=3369 RepID=UPI0025AC618C|nr:cold-responsive protein kinase 1-like [Cryptomeria japonica]